MLSIQLVPNHQSRGGVSGDHVQSYTATVISAAKVRDTVQSYTTTVISAAKVRDTTVIHSYCYKCC